MRGGWVTGWACCLLLWNKVGDGWWLVVQRSCAKQAGAPGNRHTHCNGCKALSVVLPCSDMHFVPMHAASTSSGATLPLTDPLPAVRSAAAAAAAGGNFSRVPGVPRVGGSQRGELGDLPLPRCRTARRVPCLPARHDQVSTPPLPTCCTALCCAVAACMLLRCDVRTPPACCSAALHWRHLQVAAQPAASACSAGVCKCAGGVVQAHANSLAPAPPDCRHNPRQTRHHQAVVVCPLCREPAVGQAGPTCPFHCGLAGCMHYPTVELTPLPASPIYIHAQPSSSHGLSGSMSSACSSGAADTSAATPPATAADTASEAGTATGSPAGSEAGGSTGLIAEADEQHAQRASSA